MNSDAILRELNRLVNDPLLTQLQRNIARQAMQHIRLQDEAMAELREDITDLDLPDDNDR